jgi:hypothetical protein
VPEPVETSVAQVELPDFFARLDLRDHEVASLERGVVLGVLSRPRRSSFRLALA